MCSEQSIGCTLLEQWYTSGAVQFWAFLCTHTHTHKGGAVQGQPSRRWASLVGEKGKRGQIGGDAEGGGKVGKIFPLSRTLRTQPLDPTPLENYAWGLLYIYSSALSMSYCESQFVTFTKTTNETQQKCIWTWVASTLLCCVKLCKVRLGCVRLPELHELCWAQLHHLCLIVDELCELLLVALISCDQEWLFSHCGVGLSGKSGAPPTHCNV